MQDKNQNNMSHEQHKQAVKKEVTEIHKAGNRFFSFLLGFVIWIIGFSMLETISDDNTTLILGGGALFVIVVIISFILMKINDKNSNSQLPKLYE